MTKISKIANGGTQPTAAKKINKKSRKAANAAQKQPAVNNENIKPLKQDKVEISKPAENKPAEETKAPESTETKAPETTEGEGKVKPGVKADAGKAADGTKTPEKTEGKGKTESKVKPEAKENTEKAAEKATKGMSKTAKWAIGAGIVAAVVAIYEFAKPKKTAEKTDAEAAPAQEANPEDAPKVDKFA